jgi:hypothetical protein
MQSNKDCSILYIILLSKSGQECSYVYLQPHSSPTYVMFRAMRFNISYLIYFLKSRINFRLPVNNDCYWIIVIAGFEAFAA